MFGLLLQATRLRLAVCICASSVAFVGYAPSAQAALTLSTTRIIYDSDKRSASLIVANPSTRIYAVQAWVNTSLDDTTTPVPFMPSPGLFRLNPGKQQQVQINGLPNDLPTDRESLFYFNAQEIPQATAEETNVLSIALRTRIKLFYRPAQVKGNPINSLERLQWSLQKTQGKTKLVVNNPTPFHVTFGRIEVVAEGKPHSLSNAQMALPMQQQTFSLEGVSPTPDMQVRFSAINDYGGVSKTLSAPLTHRP